MKVSRRRAIGFSRIAVIVIAAFVVHTRGAFAASTATTAAIATDPGDEIAFDFPCPTTLSTPPDIISDRLVPSATENIHRSCGWNVAQGLQKVFTINDFPLVDPINEQNFTGWFGMFTPDRSVRRTFEWPNVDLRKFLAPEVNGERQVKVRLIVKKKGSSQFTLLVDRLQLLLHPLTEVIVTGGGELPGLAAPSPADVNNNDMVTNADMDIFLNDYIGNAPTADINGDGFVDSSDVTEFYNAFGGAQ